MAIVSLTFECGDGNIFRNTVVTQINIAELGKFFHAFAHEGETHTQSGQSIELRKRTRNDDVGIFVHQLAHISNVFVDIRSISFIYIYHHVVGNLGQQAVQFIGRQTISCRIVGRCQQQDTGLYLCQGTLQVFKIILKRVAFFIQAIEMSLSVYLGSHRLIIPPWKLRNQNAIVSIRTR